MGYDFSLTEEQREENRKRLSLFKAMVSYQADPLLEMPNLDDIFNTSPVKKKVKEKSISVDMKKKNKGNKSNKLL
jgi:hypothetical protein